MNKLRVPVIAGNWKMNKVRDDALQFIYAVNQEMPNNKVVETVICAPSILLRCLVKRQGEFLRIGAQNMHYEENGAYTGEISPSMLKTTGVEYCVIGHSERRQMFNETDETVNLKVKSAISHDITAIACCGETLEERETNQEKVVLKRQVEAMFKDVSSEDAVKVIVAYEPIWAIGTGKTATSEVADETCGYVRSVIEGLYGKDVSEKVRILYGGSVKPSNVTELLAKENIDGALVGGASLDSASFVKLVKAAE